MSLTVLQLIPSQLNGTISLNTSNHHLLTNTFPLTLKITFTQVVTEHQLPTTILFRTTCTLTQKITLYELPILVGSNHLLRRLNQAFSQMGVQASSGRPLFKENCFAWKPAHFEFQSYGGA